MMNLELLNAAKDMIVNQANKDGLSLADIFGTPEQFRQAVVSMLIVSIMDIMDVEVSAAYDLVLGEGSYQTILDDCWNQLNS